MHRRISSFGVLTALTGFSLKEPANVLVYTRINGTKATPLCMVLCRLDSMAIFRLTGEKMKIICSSGEIANANDGKGRVYGSQQFPLRNIRDLFHSHYYMSSSTVSP